jgi:hypothetical protein
MYSSSYILGEQQREMTGCVSDVAEVAFASVVAR